MKDYIIKFCWTLEVPVDIKVNGEVIELDKHELYVEAEDTNNALKRLKGTKAKIISTIKSIRQC